jgi:hypothetical protein
MPGCTTTQFQGAAKAKSLGRERARKFLSNGVDDGVVCFDAGKKNARHYRLVKPEE